MPKLSKSDPPRTISERVENFLALQKLAKDSYKTLDHTMDALKKEIKSGEIVTLPDGKKVRMKDTWRGKNRVNGGMNIRRWAFEDVVE